MLLRITHFHFTRAKVEWHPGTSIVSYVEPCALQCCTITDRSDLLQAEAFFYP